MNRINIIYHIKSWVVCVCVWGGQHYKNFVSLLPINSPFDKTDYNSYNIQYIPYCNCMCPLIVVPLLVTVGNCGVFLSEVGRLRWMHSAHVAIKL